MDIVKIDINLLNPAPYNPRVDLQPSDPEYIKLKNSINSFGYVEPLVVNKRNNVIVGGHQRYKVLKDLGYKEVEVVYVDLDDSAEKGLNIALNKISGDWDAEKLEDLLRELNVDTDFDVLLTGFDTSELEELFGDAQDLDENEYGVPREEIDGDEFDPEKMQENEDNPRGIKLGDIFRIGRHTLICGDSTDKRFVDALIGEKKVDLVMMDPPYDMDFDDGGGLNAMQKSVNGERESSLEQLNRAIHSNKQRLSGLEVLHKCIDKPLK